MLLNTQNGCSTQKTAVDTTAVLTVEVDTEESYLRSVQDIYSKLSNKIKRALEKHKLTKHRKEERKKQVNQTFYIVTTFQYLY